MTDLQKFIQLYAEVGIPLAPTFDEQLQQYTLTIAARMHQKVKGYTCFFTDLTFDKDGKFIEQGVWE